MLRNCEKIMTPIPLTTNEWPQIVDDHKSFMASSSSAANKAMAEKNNQDPPPPPHHQQPLKCPRCDSSNTKFCYYNNYSLSQPRHFCKACKRYWTRGGTLRNVPVGGGCRKNKRPKRQSSSGCGGDGIPSAASTGATNPSVQPQIDLTPASNRIHNPLFYSLPTNPLELNFPFSSFRVSSDNTGFDLQPQMNNLGIGFSSGLVIDNDHKNGLKPIQDVISNSSSSPFSSAAGNNNSIFFGSSNFASTSTMASLLASRLQQQKFGDVQDVNGIPALMPFGAAQIPGANIGVNLGKEVKIEGENRSVWNPNPNPIEQISSSDPSSLVWNTTNISAWFDPSNMGSSVPSLI